MKSIIYYLLFIIITFHSCQGQEKNELNQIVKIQAVKNSIKCKNHKARFTYNFPDILGKNESNFFNNTIIKDYSNYIESKDISKTPKEIIQNTILYKKKECNQKNIYVGFMGSNYNITFNNSKILSLNVNFESFSGKINVDSYNYNFDVQQKKILRYSDVLKDEKINELVIICNTILNDRLKDLYAENKDELDESDVYNSLIDSKEIFNKTNLDSFSIQEKGIEFIFNYGFQNGLFDIDNNLYFPYKDFPNYFKEDFTKKLSK